MNPDEDLYVRLAPYYDWMSRALLAPFGGDHAFRKRVIATWDIRPGQRVLELGCGTGLMTQHLIRAGADVTAVDRSPDMLARARRRAPEASYLEQDLNRLEVTGSFDRVIISYVLHELSEQLRQVVLAAARDKLSDAGRVAIVDFELGQPGVVRAALAWYLRWAEPPSASSWATSGFRDEVTRANLVVESSRPVGWGTARSALLRPLAR